MRPSVRFAQAVGCLLLGLSLLWQLSEPAFAQPPDLPISVGDSGVGYIDSAVMGNQVRFRFDSTYGANKPNRAEYLWAWSPPLGPGPPADESSTDYQRLTAYLEYAVDPMFSVFVDAGALFVNPEINDNTAGLGDLKTGFKLGLYADCDSLVTFQLKAYVPTGDADRALGTGHVSLEPGLLLYQQLGRFTLEAELRDWIPIDGSAGRQGNILRYGVGASTDLGSIGLPNVRPVAEFVGWSVLDGKARFVTPSGVVTEDADGHTIVNAKFGARFLLGNQRDLYVGYGRSLTGQRWYNDIIRADVRFRF